MWLRHFTERASRLASPLVAVAVLLAGCASGPVPAPMPATGEADAARAVPPRAQTLYEQATAILAGGDYTEAELRFNEFVLQYPDYPGAWTNLAIIAAAGDDDDKAAQAIDRALALDAGYAPALNQLGMLRRRQGRFADADLAYEQAVTAAPDYALAWYNRGVLNELYLQRLEVALQAFERYQALSGDDGQVVKWIVDLKRRIGVDQRTANVTE